MIKSIPFSRGPISQEIWEIWSSILRFTKGAKYFPNEVSSCPEKPTRDIGFSHCITKMLWIWALSWLRIKILAPVLKSVWIFLGPSNVLMVTVCNNLENILGCICGFFKGPFGVRSSWTGCNRLFGIVKGIWYLSRKFDY
jgi:hypothetical protein